VDGRRISELEELNARTQGSAEMFRRAGRVMPGGVPSSFQLREPWPIYLVRGEGPRVWDVDGNEYLDFHNGFGSMGAGLCSPRDRGRGRRALRTGHPLRRPQVVT
jgi:glutamate-1-semialdehyde 2,1-aminomutase